MMQSTVNGQADVPAPLHVAIIMDGNGRWATRRGLPRSAGHRAGVLAARRVVEAAPGLGVSALTLFAFSSDNWRRPRDEVSALMSLLREYLRAELRRLVENGARLTVIGRRDRLPKDLREAIAEAEQASASGERLLLRIALDYSSRDAIAQAAARWRGGHAPSRDDFARLLASPDCENAGDVDLLIRSGGKKDCRIFSFGRRPTPSSASSTPCGPISAPTICRRDRRFPSSRSALRRPGECRTAGRGGMSRYLTMFL